MTTQEIVSKLWNLCNVLRDDGITYHQYVTELTYILFLKMAKETGAESQIPAAYRWDQLTAKSGIELKKFYKELLTHLGENCTGRVREIYQGSATNIDEPKNLEKIITTIDGLDWYSAREEGLGNLYEGLLEKNANEKKSGAGQYFTPRVLIDVMTRLMKPQPGERCNDPACGTFGFMIAAHRYVKEHTDDFYDLDSDLAKFEREEAFTGCELVHDTHRLALMNVLFNRTNSPALVGKTSIYRGEYPAIYAGYLIKLDYDRSRVIGDYLNYSLNTVSAKEYCNSVKTDGVNQSNINAKKIGAYIFAMPQIDEQAEIVRLLNDLLIKEQQAKEAAEGVMEQIDLIKKSILARAFRGELGTNDPGEESVEELLFSKS